MSDFNRNMSNEERVHLVDQTQSDSPSQADVAATQILTQIFLDLGAIRFALEELLSYKQAEKHS